MDLKLPVADREDDELLTAIATIAAIVASKLFRRIARRFSNASPRT